MKRLAIWMVVWGLAGGITSAWLPCAGATNVGEQPTSNVQRPTSNKPGSTLAMTSAASEVLTRQPLPRLDPTTALAVTDGLIRWWPNLFDVRDEITGQEGVVMGVLPPVETGTEDETEFGRRTGWVQLQPALTNQVFTLSFWVRLLATPPDGWQWLLGQESRDGEWYLQTDRTLRGLVIGTCEWSDTNLTERAEMTPGRWSHVALARRADGTSALWVEGVRQFDGRLVRSWPGNSPWLTVGNSPGGGEHDFHGSVCDLCVFDRVLSDVEVRALHAAGLPRRPAHNTAARLAATQQPVVGEARANLVRPPPQTWAHGRFTTEDGLPGNVVTAVLQARNGQLWVGTEDGLARFDGRTFLAFTKENTPALGAVGHRVCSLAEDEDQTLWAGIFGGLLRIRNGQFAAFTNGLPQRYVLQAMPAGEGWLWIAGFKTEIPRGPCWLRRYHPDSGTSSSEIILPGHPRRLVSVTNGVWLATEQPEQMLFWDGRSAAAKVVGKVERLPPTVHLGGGALLSEASVRVWERRDGRTNVWTEVRLGDGRPTFQWYWDSRWRRPFLSRWSGPPGPEDWLGVTFGRARLRGERLEVVEVPDHPDLQEVSCLCANREGGAWLGTEQDGLHFVQERLVRMFTTQDGMSANDVRSVCATADGGVWAATGKGLSRWSAGAWTVQEPDGQFKAVVCDRAGEPWYSRPGIGPASLSQGTRPPRGAFVVLGVDWRHPTSLRFARDGTLWIACEYGLTWLKPERLKPDHNANWVPAPPSTEAAFGRYAVGQELPAKMFPVGLVEDRDGSMWLGSVANGLFHVANGRVEAFGRKEGLPGDSCAPVHLDDTGALWIVAEGSLVRRVDRRFQQLDARAGLPKDTLLDLVEDDLGNFWISGKRGIHRLVRRELEECFAGRRERVRSLTLGARDGLLTPECSSLHYPTMAKTPDGHIWVATRNGLAMFDPSQVHLDAQPLPSVIERIVVNREDIANLPSRPAQPLRLRPGSGRELVFHYTATSLLGADRVRFRHRLDGYDSDWSPETDLRLAFYTNLRPGAYRFRVKAANVHGIWSDQDTALDFIILPYFWQTRWFLALAVALGLGLALGLHRRRLAGQRRLQELKHRQALTDEKARIAADMHDELGATLTQISILGELGKGRVDDVAQTRSTLTRISQAARDVTSRMSDLVWATNPRHDTLDDLVAFLREHAASRLESAAIRSRLEFPANVPATQVSATFRRNLVLVLKESLTNIVKHAAASEVTVRLEVAGARLMLQVQDNGGGFEPSPQASAGNGLGNMQQRVRDLRGQFYLTSAPGQGTRLEVRVPLDHGS